LREVKQWLDENDNSAIQEMRKPLQDNIYVRIVGTIKEYDGKRQSWPIPSDPCPQGNQLALEVVYEAERGARKTLWHNASGMMQGVGFSGGNAGQQRSWCSTRGCQQWWWRWRDSVLPVHC
jgi:hypothetical protein